MICCVACGARAPARSRRPNPSRSPSEAPPRHRAPAARLSARVGRLVGGAHSDQPWPTSADRPPPPRSSRTAFGKLQRRRRTIASVAPLSPNAPPIDMRARRSRACRCLLMASVTLRSRHANLPIGARMTYSSCSDGFLIVCAGFHGPILLINMVLEGDG